MHLQKKGCQKSSVLPDKDAHVPSPDLRKCPPKKKQKGAKDPAVLPGKHAPKKKEKCAKDPAVLPDEHAPVPPDLQKRPPENNTMTTVLMPIGTYAATGMLPYTREYEMPTLPAIQPPEARNLSRRNQTPAPEPPTVIGIQPEHFAMTPAAAKMSSDTNSQSILSTTFLEEAEDDGNASNVLSTTFLKEADDDGDACNAFNDDDDLFYLDDEELDEEFERELDEVACTIEYSNPKIFNHGHRWTTLIVGGPTPPNYEGKTTTEKAFLKK